EPTRFFLLEPLADASPASSRSGTGPAIGIGPVEIPRYLDRPNIVTRGASNEVQVADFVLWAEPLVDGVPRILAEDLSALLGTERVYGFPAKLPETLDFRVSVEVLRFDGTLGGEARFEARWTVLDLRQGLHVAARRSSVKTRKVQGPDYGALVTAMSGTLADLGTEIGGLLRGL
ncbi:MAG: membrane integrity-associated transporter subunit PqiC, partial [Proteobacteria bacterium]|nr:membrane integrity-associated transporter subunit PqiC [Pseudomonadota bacterium]